MASISSGVLTRRTRRSIGSASTNSAEGNAFGNICADDGDRASVATVRTESAPSMFWSTFRNVIRLNEMP